MQSKLTIQDDGTELERFKDLKRRYIYVLQTPSIGKIYTGITSHIFKKYICWLLKAVQECFALQFLLLIEPFERSAISSILGIVNVSDENESFTPNKPSCFQRSVGICIDGSESRASDLEKNGK